MAGERDEEHTASVCRLRTSRGHAPGRRVTRGGCDGPVAREVRNGEGGLPDPVVVSAVASPPTHRRRRPSRVCPARRRHPWPPHDHGRPPRPAGPAPPRRPEPAPPRSPRARQRHPAPRERARAACGLVSSSAMARSPRAEMWVLSPRHGAAGAVFFSARRRTDPEGRHGIRRIEPHPSTARGCDDLRIPLSPPSAAVELAPAGAGDTPRLNVRPRWATPGRQSVMTPKELPHAR